MRIIVQKGTTILEKERGIKKRAIRQSCDNFDDFYSPPISPSFVSFCDLRLRPVYSFILE